MSPRGHESVYGEAAEPGMRTAPPPTALPLVTAGVRALSVGDLAAAPGQCP